MYSAVYSSESVLLFWQKIDFEKMGGDARLCFVLTLYQNLAWILPNVVFWRSKKLHDSFVNEVKRTETYHMIDWIFFGNVNFMQEKAEIL